MSINTVPLKLYDLAVFQVVISTSCTTSAANRRVTAKLKHLRFKGKFFDPELLKDILYVRNQCYMKLKKLAGDFSHSILAYYMKALLESYIYYNNNLGCDFNCVKLANFEEKRDACTLKLLHFLPYVTIDLVIDSMFEIFEIEPKLLIIILHNVKGYTMLNNFLILGSYYQMKEIVKLAALKGADDFDSARKVACLLQDDDMDQYLIELDGSVDLSMYTSTSEYRNYYNIIRREERSPAYKRHLAEDHLKSLLTKHYPLTLDDKSTWIEELDLPIASWHQENFLKVLPVFPIYEVDRIVKTFITQN